MTEHVKLNDDRGHGEITLTIPWELAGTIREAALRDGFPAMYLNRYITKALTEYTHRTEATRQRIKRYARGDIVTPRESLTRQCRDWPH